MVEPLLHIKTELARRGKRVKDLANALQWNYGKVSRILNGFQVTPADFDKRVNKIIQSWDAGKNQNGRIS